MKLFVLILIKILGQLNLIERQDIKANDKKKNNFRKILVYRFLLLEF